jgi:hypothetical protein
MRETLILLCVLGAVFAVLGAFSIAAGIRAIEAAVRAPIAPPYLKQNTVPAAWQVLE